MTPEVKTCLRSALAQRHCLSIHLLSASIARHWSWLCLPEFPQPDFWNAGARSERPQEGRPGPAGPDGPDGPYRKVSDIVMKQEKGELPPSRLESRLLGLLVMREVVVEEEQQLPVDAPQQERQGCRRREE